MVHGLLRADVPGLLAHDDHQLRLVVIAALPGGQHHIGAAGGQGIVKLGKQHRVLRHLHVDPGGVAAVVQPHADQLAHPVHHIGKHRLFHHRQLFVCRQLFQGAAAAPGDQRFHAAGVAGGGGVYQATLRHQGQMGLIAHHDIVKLHVQTSCVTYLCCTQDALYTGLPRHASVSRSALPKAPGPGSAVHSHRLR